MMLTVVTGGARGIGAAICRRLAGDGHDIVLGYRSATGRAEETAAAVRAAGARCELVQMDTASATDVDRLFDIAAGLGQITGLVNNAGIVGPTGRLVEVPVDELAQVYEVNVVGVLLCARRAVLDGARAIVNISSAAATLGSPGEYVHYAGSKAAVDAITVGLAKELAPIRVNAVSPGTIWTEIHSDPERPAKMAARIPFGRSGQPEEVAGAVSWLLSDDASYTSGAILRIAGGL